MGGVTPFDSTVGLRRYEDLAPSNTVVLDGHCNMKGTKLAGWEEADRNGEMPQECGKVQA